MDRASIGGSVNLVTKSAFNRAADRVFNYTIGFVTRPTHKHDEATWKQPISGFGPSMNFIYSGVHGEKKNIGIMLTGTCTACREAARPPSWLLSAGARPGPVSRIPREGRVEGRRNRGSGADLKLDYKWSEKTTISVNIL